MLCMGAKTNDPLQKPLLVTRVKESRKVEQKDDEGEEGGGEGEGRERDGDFFRWRLGGGRGGVS